MQKSKDFKVDFIGVGDQKAGTSWIMACLREHPEICGAKYKETRFFNVDDLYKKGLGYYEELFRCEGGTRIKGEYSPSYLHHPETAERIGKHFPGVKIILSLRNPVDKAYSAYWFNRFGGTGSTAIYKTFEECLEKNKDFKERHINYQKVKRYFDIFPQGQVFVCLYDDIEQEPKRTITSIYRFLGVDPGFTPPSLNKQVNPTGGRVLRLPWLNKFLTRAYKLFTRWTIGGRLLAWINKDTVLRFMTKRLNRSARALPVRPRMNPETRRELQKYYAGDIKEIARLIKRDLSIWKN